MELREPNAISRRVGPGLARLWRDRRASMAIEYAFVAPAFIALILASLHTSLVFVAQQGLETAAESAARLILTGQAQTNYSGTTTQQQADFQAAACAALPPFLTCNRLYVDVETVSSYAQAQSMMTTGPKFTYDKNGNVTNTFNYSPGAQGSIVVLRLMYLWPTMTGPMGFSLVNSGQSNRLLVATSVMKTEGY